MATVVAVLLSASALQAESSVGGRDPSAARFCSTLLARHPDLGRHLFFRGLRRFCIISIAEAYLDSIDFAPPGEILPELEEVLAPDARRWINRSRTLDPPNNVGAEELIAGVRREPDCDFVNRRWVVEGDVGSITMDVFCAGFAPAVVRDRFLVEGGLLSEVEVLFVSVTTR